ncbi:MAG: response regulator [Armatimonadetes bacterium]|nr:response regulator [Armatimonadota bacterium]
MEQDLPKILVVDDKAHIVRMMKEYLERNGYQVVTAGNGEEALVKAREENPDLILCDEEMPGMSGAEVLKRVRSGEAAFRMVPFIAVTVHAANQEWLDKWLFEADDYLTKPFGESEIVALVQKGLGR